MNTADSHQGLRGNTESVDNEGNVTPQSLGRYVYRTIMSLPPEKPPRQTPITRAEESGDVILASHPELGRKVEAPTIPTPDEREKGPRKSNKYRLIIPIIVATIVVGGIIIFLPGSFSHPAFNKGNLTSVIYNSGFNNGTQKALADTQSGRLFNPSCDPTGVHASGGQHPTPFCTGWTSGYIPEWKNKHPDWNSGNISSWKPNTPPDNCLYRYYTDMN